MSSVQGSGCGQIDAGLQRAQVDRLAIGDAADGEGEVGRTAAAPGRRGRLYEVDARRQVTLDSRVEAGAAVIVVREPAFIFSQQIEEGVPLFGDQVDPDPSALTHSKRYVWASLPVPKARIAVFGSPAPIGGQLGIRLGAERAKVVHLAGRLLLGPRRATPAQDQQADGQRGHEARYRQRSHSNVLMLFHGHISSFERAEEPDQAERNLMIYYITGRGR